MIFCLTYLLFSWLSRFYEQSNEQSNSYVAIVKMGLEEKDTEYFIQWGDLDVCC